MSAIWGYIDKKNTITDDIVSCMRQSMEQYQIDRFETITKERVSFSCGHQHFTKEAVKDVSPIYDEAHGLWFTADCYLYNREALLKELVGFDKTDLQSCGDAELAYHAYLRFGKDFVTRLRGSFAVAIYLENEQQVFLYTDHVAQRYLAYYNCDTFFSFSTTYSALLSCIGAEHISLNKKWILAAYTDCTADTIKLPGCTVYENIYHVTPGCYLKIDLSSGNTEKISYWNPLYSAQKLSKMTDAQYKELFVSTFQAATKHLLRTTGEVGILLSGGLDSASVAAMAAPVLAKENKKLFSYTAVPCSDFSYENNRLQMENETVYILEQQKFHKNLVPRFISMDDKNCFTDLKTFVKLFEEPVKPALNMVNLDGMRQAAQADGCRILLSGQNGNATISYGRILTYVYQKLFGGHFLSAYREANAFCRRHGTPKKRFLHIFLSELKEKWFKKSSLGEDCLLQKTDIKAHRILELITKTENERGTGALDSKKQRRNFCFMPLVFQHMGYYDTYSSLHYGMLSLDPTLTVEMLELCMELPIDCYVKGGRERRAVRDYLKGYVPDAILENHSARGVQAADYAHRVNRDWNSIKDEVYRILQTPGLSEYLDRKKLDALVQELKENEYQLDKSQVAIAAVTSSLGYFLESFEKIKQNA